MAEMSGTIFDAALVDVVLSLVYGFPEHLRSGADVADFDCGSGHAINVLVRAFSASRFTGIDFFDEAIAIHTTEVARLSLGNVTVESHNLVRLDRAAAYDVIIVFDTIHDQTQPVRMLENDLSHPATRRCDPNGQHQGVKPARRQCRCLDEHLTVYGLTDALPSLMHYKVPDWMRCGEGSWPPRCSATSDLTTCGWSRSSPTRSTITTSPQNCSI